jgi:hypothetical protein
MVEGVSACGLASGKVVVPSRTPAKGTAAMRGRVRCGDRRNSGSRGAGLAACGESESARTQSESEGISIMAAQRCGGRSRRWRNSLT